MRSRPLKPYCSGSGVPRDCRQRRHDVDQASERVGRLGLRIQPRVRDDQRNVERLAIDVVELLAHPPMRHGELAVIAGAHDQRVVGEPARIERVEHLEDLRVDLLIEVRVEARIGQLALAGEHVSRADREQLPERACTLGLVERSSSMFGGRSIGRSLKSSSR